MTSMRFLFVTMEFAPDPGGAQRYYEEVARALAEHTAVLAPPRMGSDDFPFRVHRTPFFSNRVWPRWLPLCFHMLRAVIREKPSALLVGEVLPVGVIAWMLRLLLGIPYVVFTHGYDVLLPQRQSRKRWLLKRVVRAAALMVANSQFTASQLRLLGVAPQHLLVVNPGCSIVEEHADPTIIERMRTRFPQDNMPLVLSLGRLVERKGIDIVLRALQRLSSDGIAATYLIAGDGPARPVLEQRAREFGLSSRVHFLGRVSDAEKIALYTIADVFIMVPKQDALDVEGFGIVYLEANAFGKPVIGSATGGVPEAVRDGITGLLVPPGDVNATATALKRVLTDLSIRHRLGTAGREYVRTYCTWAQRLAPLRLRLRQIAEEKT